MSGIDATIINGQYNASFQGSQIPEIDQNVLLEEQRQLYIEEQIKKYPTLLINKNQYTKFDPTYIKNQICYKIHPDPSKQTA